MFGDITAGGRMYLCMCILMYVCAMHVFEFLGLFNNQSEFYYNKYNIHTFLRFYMYIVCVRTYIHDYVRMYISIIV